MITTNTLPDISQHQLFLLLRYWAHETEFQEQLGHLGASDFNIWFILIGVLRHLNNLKLVTRLLEIGVEPVMNHLVGQRVDLHLWRCRFLLEICFVGLLLLLAASRVFEDGIEITLQLF